MKSSSFSEEVDTVRGRNSETGGRFPHLVSAFAKRQKSDKEDDAATVQ